MTSSESTRAIPTAASTKTPTLPAPAPQYQLANEIAELIEFFEYNHLPDGELRAVSMDLCELAWNLQNRLSPTYELLFAFRQLLLAKDAFVRCALLDGR